MLKGANQGEKKPFRYSEPSHLDLLTPEPERDLQDSLFCGVQEERYRITSNVVGFYNILCEYKYSLPVAASRTILETTVLSQ